PDVGFSSAVICRTSVVFPVPLVQEWKEPHPQKRPDRFPYSRRCHLGNVNETANGNHRFLCRSFIKAPVPRRSMRIQIVSGVFTGYWYSLILFSMVPPSSCICRLMG